ncbi:MAG: phage portal protein, partial [Christensenellaceae bacterium]
SKDQIIPYGPDIRDVSLFHGLDQMLKRIEYNVGLSFGTLSDPVNVDKTATEVVSSKQRMYTTVKDIQKSLQDFLEDLIYAIAARRSLADLPVNMDYELSFNWDDSLIVDKQAEQMIRMQEVNAGILDPVQYLMWRYGVEEEEARKMMIKKVDAQETTAAIDTVMANWSKDGKNADTGTD